MKVHCVILSNFSNSGDDVLYYFSKDFAKSDVVSKINELREQFGLPADVQVSKLKAGIKEINDKFTTLGIADLVEIKFSTINVIGQPIIKKGGGVTIKSGRPTLDPFAF